jgi:hypothetical protein
MHLSINWGRATSFPHEAVILSDRNRIAVHPEAIKADTMLIQLADPV